MPMLPKPRSSALERAERRAKRDEAAAKLRRQVRERDKHRCRICSRAVIPGVVMPEYRAEVHHIESRALRPDRVDDPTNMVTLCYLDHEAIRMHEIVTYGTTSDTFRWERVKRPA